METQSQWVLSKEPASWHNKPNGYCAITGVYRSTYELEPRHRAPTEPTLNAAKYVLSGFPHPDLALTKLAFIDSATDARLTFAEFRRRVSFLSAGLYSGIGVRKGDVVLVVAPNSLVYPAVCLAVLAIGAVLTTANPINTASEITKQVEDSGATLAVVSPDQQHKVASAGIDMILTHHSGSSDELISVEDLINEGEAMKEEDTPEIRQSDTAALLYSSGTTGASKGVMLTHGNLIAMVALIKWSLDVTATADDVFLAFVPMFHIYGLAFFALGHLAAKSTVIVMPRFDLRAMLRAIERHRVNNLPAVPPVILAMARSEHAKSHDLSSLRLVSSGAAPLSESVSAAFQRRFPWVEVKQGYGLTESTGAATFFTSASEAKARPRSVGRLLPGFEAKITETARGAAVEPGKEGELWLRSGTVMKGYFGKDAATAAAVDGEGWLRTGDLSYFDDDGYVYIVERMKEMIKHKGYQVAPAELEAVLLAHPDIVDAAVVPVEDEEAGQVPVAYVVRKGPASASATAEEVAEFVGKRVAPYKRLKWVQFIESIPKSAAGKILRKELVLLAAQAQVCKL